MTAEGEPALDAERGVPRPWFSTWLTAASRRWASRPANANATTAATAPMIPNPTEHDPDRDQPTADGHREVLAVTDGGQGGDRLHGDLVTPHCRHPDRRR